ncbi:hypothetical protein ACLOJK_019839 [Asimina triloba]
MIDTPPVFLFAQRHCPPFKIFDFIFPFIFGIAIVVSRATGQRHHRRCKQGYAGGPSSFQSSSAAIFLSLAVVSSLFLCLSLSSFRLPSSLPLPFPLPSFPFPLSVCLAVSSFRQLVVRSRHCLPPPSSAFLCLSSFRRARASAHRSCHAAFLLSVLVSFDSFRLAALLCLTSPATACFPALPRHSPVTATACSASPVATRVAVSHLPRQGQGKREQFIIAVVI